MYVNTWKKSLWKIWRRFGWIWTHLDSFGFKTWMYKRKDFFYQHFFNLLYLFSWLFELSESLNVLSDNNFHLKNCMNIQFHWYNHLKYQFVCKYMEKITMENLDWFWMDLDLKLGCIKEKIKIQWEFAEIEFVKKFYFCLFVGVFPY